MVRCLTVSTLVLLPGVPAAIGSALPGVGRVAVPEPDLEAPTRAGELIVYPDVSRPDLYYYPPGNLRLATEEDERPELQLLQMRYTGTAAMGDQGARMLRSLLSFRVIMDGPAAEELESARNWLRTRAAGSGSQMAIELRPVPVQRLETALMYTPIGAPDLQPARPLPEGRLEVAGEAEPDADEGFWRERVYTLPLDTATSEALAHAIREGGIVLSVAYAFTARGTARMSAAESLAGSPELVAELRRRLGWDEDEDADGAESTPEAATGLVHAGALAIRVDGRRWPDLVLQLDINEGVPPGYALLDIYCYDFRDELRADLYEKWVEIRAEAVGGGPASILVVFSRDEPRAYAQSGRFPVSVRLDRPYDYRVTEITEEGEMSIGPWHTAESWTDLLDVTSAPGDGDSGSPEPDATTDRTGEP